MGRSSHHHSSHGEQTIEMGSTGGSSTTVHTSGGSSSRHTEKTTVIVSEGSDVYIEDPDKQLKLCLCCSFTWALFAIVLAIVALATDFWYLGRSEVNGMHLAYSYGVVKDCYYEYANKDSLDTKDKGWVCHKWQDTATHDHDVLTDDCKSASQVSLAFSIIGVVATAPACVICILIGCCFLHDHRNRFKCMHIVAMSLLALAVLSYVIAPSVLAGQCHEMNEHFKWVEYIGPFSGTKYTPLDFDIDVHFSFILVIIALFFVLTALVCYMVFYFEWDRRIYRVHRRHYHHSSHHHGGHGTESATLVNTDGENVINTGDLTGDGHHHHKSHHSSKHHHTKHEQS